MFDSKSVTALLGMARYSGQPSLVLVALDRLTPLVGRCGAAEYQRIAQQPGGGVLAATHQLMLMSLAARKAKSTPDLASSGGCSTDGSSSGPAAAGCSRPDAVKHVHPWDAALAAATEVTQGITSSFMAFGAASKLPVAPPKPDFSLPQAGALRDAAQCLLLACLDRARRQFGLKPMQVSRAPMVFVSHTVNKHTALIIRLRYHGVRHVVSLLCFPRRRLAMATGPRFAPATCSC